MRIASAAGLIALLGLLGLQVPAAMAKVPASKAAELDGPAFTCIGAERAGNQDGSIPAYSGKWVGTWPGQTKAHGYEPGPYKDEKPLFTITAQNVAKYADRLTEGQKALFGKYPQSFRMHVYSSHRDFGNPAFVCDTARKNALTSELVNEGLGVTGTSGAIPFPFPQNGLEATWNIINPYRAWTEKAVVDIADVYANGGIVWGRLRYMTMAPGNHPEKRGSLQDKVAGHFFTAYLLPERDKGLTATGYQPNDYSKDATHAWQYQPGTRRVRLAPEICCDYPVPPGSLRTADDDYVFNGSPERYNWKLLGKKELYLPYHNFRVNDPALKYKDLIKPNTLNPDYERYELRRVWVVEATLKEGMRHIYARRVLYADEDSWLALWADNHDGRGELWRVAFANYFYSQESKGFHRGVSVYHDLASGAYEAGYLVNERGEDWWRINLPLKPNQFGPEAAGRAGH